MVEVVFDDGGELVALVIDAAPEERHRVSAVATEHPVARGVDVTDHVRRERRPFTVEVVISDTPIRANDAIGGNFLPTDLELPRGWGTQPAAKGQPGGKWRAADIEDRAAPRISASVWTPDATEVARTRDAWALLVDALDRALLCTVTTRLETHESMVLIEASVTRRAADYSWIRAELTFAEIRTVATETVDDPAPVRPRDRAQVDRGSQPKAPASPRLQSLLDRSLTPQGRAEIFRDFTSFGGA